MPIQMDRFPHKKKYMYIYIYIRCARSFTSVILIGKLRQRLLFYINTEVVREEREGLSLEVKLNKSFILSHLQNSKLVSGSQCM